MTSSSSSQLPIVDQSRPICCKIIDTETTSFTNYVICVRHGFGDREFSWTVRRRYREFCKLQGELTDAGLPVELPAKQLFGNRNPEFVAERKAGLQKFLDLLMGHLMVSMSIYVWRFLYPADYKEECNEAMLMCIRNLRGRGWQFVRSWKHAGWRLNKCFSLVQTPTAAPGKYAERVVSWVSGPADVDLHGDLREALKWLCGLDNVPYILRPLMCEPCGSGVMIVHNWLMDGTLRDHFCRAKPHENYLKKYSNPDTVYPLGLDDIRCVGRHILEALLLLKKLSIPYGNLHAGNVGLFRASPSGGNVCVLTDVESGLLRLKSYYWPLMLQLRNIQTLEHVDMYCFGHTIFELATGDALMQPCIPYGAQLTCDRRIQALLYELLTEESIQAGLPSIEDMLKHEFFASVSVFKPPSLRVSMSRAVQCAMQDAAQALIDELKHDQTQFRRSVRTVKYESWLNSEQHRKQRQRAVRQGNSVLADKSPAVSPQSAPALVSEAQPQQSAA